ncbi:helix-turn-helix domain-containing protein [Inconstantimicrobium mannanitabidum]|uniref:Uncharacterized protein n=1 Tax=Inconstantimicrobium mannanitabidum TaxID=1604901 RepID=A0ACB5RIT0_9CLOT|nr:helix-turn-helix domain-containing protein [Clostridium sp. TW13]GKX68977.1 hypothetical protein rsdtw13_42350 [Clostridium sp. TW13]
MITAIRNLENRSKNELKLNGDEKIINMAITQLDLLHNKDDGFITIAVKKDNRFLQYHYKIQSLRANIGKVLSIEDVNIYVSPNSYFKPYRRIENIRKLNALYIDIDFYNSKHYQNSSYDGVKYILEHDYFGKTVPEPSFIINTGRGMAVYWLIEPVPYKALPLWNGLQKYLLKELEDVGADSKSIDSARIMRLAGSTNQKNKVKAQIEIYNDYIYSLREIQENYLPELTPYVKNPMHKQKGRKAKVVKLYNMFSLHHARLLDLIKLQELRQGYCRNSDGELVIHGQRELMCFLYRYWSNCFTGDKEKALEDTLEFNSNFKKPLSNKEVEKITESANRAYEEWLLNDFNLVKNEKGEVDEATKVKLQKVIGRSKVYKTLGYNYKNATLIQLLSITAEEMKELSTIIDNKEKRCRDYSNRKVKRRNDIGLNRREREKLNRVEAIKELREQGLTQKEVAEKLGVSERTIRRYDNL